MSAHGMCADRIDGRLALAGKVVTGSDGVNATGFRGCAALVHMVASEWERRSDVNAADD